MHLDIHTLALVLGRTIEARQIGGQGRGASGARRSRRFNSRNQSWPGVFNPVGIRTVKQRERRTPSPNCTSLNRAGWKIEVGGGVKARPRGDWALRGRSGTGAGELGQVLGDAFLGGPN